MPRRLDTYDPVPLQGIIDALPNRRLDDATKAEILRDYGIELDERKTVRALGKLGARLVELAVKAAASG